VAAELLCTVGDALASGADNLIAPVLTGVFVGVALRWTAISGEVTEHDARTEELNADLIRWVRDRNRALEAEIWHAINLARQGIIEDVVAPPVPPELEGTTPGSQADSGGFLRRVERLMRTALHEYRDQASRTARSLLVQGPVSSAGSGLSGLVLLGGGWAGRWRGCWCGLCARGRPALLRSATLGLAPGPAT
jgi:hypothetical protein